MSGCISYSSIIKSNDLTENGYPFFAGRIKLTRNIQVEDGNFSKTILKLKSPNSIVQNIFFNHHAAGSIIWKPYTLDITEFLKVGSNEITCELVTSLRNLLGPLHNTNYRPILVGPEQFDNELNWSDSYTLVNFGLPDNFRIEFY